MSSRPQLQRMAGSGTATFNNPVDYKTALDGACLTLTIIESGEFKARLSWSTLRSVCVVGGCENLARIGYIALPARRVYFLFRTNATAAIWGGRELRAGEIVFWAGGERAHYRTAGGSAWGLVSVPPNQLSACSKALTGLEEAETLDGRMLRPSRSISNELLRLHSKVCRLAEGKRERLAHPEVARALEQEILHTLIKCLSSDSGNPDRKGQAKRRHANIMNKFEDAIGLHAGRLEMSELCAALSIPERTLRACCAEVLGMNPTSYHLLRRLNLARAGLLSDPDRAGVADIARRCGFAELGRFAAAYRATFGELPSATWRRASVK